MSPSQKRTVWIIIVLLVIGIAYAHWRQRSSVSSSDTIKIGILAPLTGPGAVFGNSLVNGVKLAQEDMKNTKHRYELVIEDDGTNPAQSSSGAQKLINVDKVKALITVTSGTGSAAAPIADAGKVVHFCVCSAIKVGYGTYNFTNSLLPDDEAGGWVKEAQKHGVKKVAILSQIQPGIDAIVNALKPQAEAAGIKVVYAERFESNNRDFQTILSKAKQSNPDIYFVISFPPSLDILGQEIKNFDLGKPISTAAAFGLSATPALFEGYWYTDAALSDTPFQNRFEMAFPGVRFNVRAAPSGYDSYRLLVQGFESGNDIATYVQNLTEYDGETGHVTRAPGSNNFRAPPGLWIIKNGKATAFQD